MQIVKSKNIDYKEIAACLKKGGIILYPTDTAYALGCDATNEKAVDKIFTIKDRVQGKTLPLIVADDTMAVEWFSFSEKAQDLAQEFWPGPLTLILEIKKQGLATSAVQDGFAALRVPKSDIAQSVSRELGLPIVSTSANIAGENSCYSIDDVRTSLGEHITMVDYGIDSGMLPHTKVSTIAKVCDNKVEILREGAIILKSK
jgi:L-threonylcarbamoyladenylate synthase